MNQYPKRLIEVDLPIKRISEHARLEKKSAGHGSLTTLHIWWARRPLAACRAVICASLWFDPADELCPESFRVVARAEMRRWGRDGRTYMGGETFARFQEANKSKQLYEDDVVLRSLLLDFIADFANPDNSLQEGYLRTSRALTTAAHIANDGEEDTRPLVVDPFAGGGAIPIEASRIGGDVFASDLNPVATLLNQVLLKILPNAGDDLPGLILEWGEKLRDEVEAEVGHLYGTDDERLLPVAYLWARTIRCEGPTCGGTVPLIRSLWLQKKGKTKVCLEIKPDRNRNSVGFEVVSNPKHVGEGTVKRGSVTCPLCGFTTPVASVRKQLIGRQGGTLDAQCVAVVSSIQGVPGRLFRVPNQKDLEGVQKSIEIVNGMLAEWKIQGRKIPLSEELPLMSGVFNAPIYGIDEWRLLYSPRQYLMLLKFSEKIATIMDREETHYLSKELRKGLVVSLALVQSKLADVANALCNWEPNVPTVQHLFGRQAIQMSWDFAEGNILGNSRGSWLLCLQSLAKVVEANSNLWSEGTVAMCDATQHVLPDDSAAAVITDPPYYNAVPFADLSDFFYVWLRLALKESSPDLFESPLTPKDSEITEMSGWDPVRYSHKDKGFFESEMGKAMADARRILNPNGIGVVVFAHKSTSGWEAQLQAMVDAGWTVTGSWALDTELGTRLRAMNSAVLASSVWIVCRPRENADGSIVLDRIGDWREVLRELPVRIHEWMPRLAREGVVGADSIFACLGPALEIFSRYSIVEKPNGDQVKLAEYLEYIWAAVAKEALDMIFEGADATGFEEDARLTAMWLWTLFAGASAAESSDIEDETGESGDDESGGKSAKTKGYILEYDAARKIAQGLGAHLEDLTSIIEVKGDKARLLPVSERARDLFGYIDSSATEKKRKTKAQKKLFEEMEEFEYESTTGIGGAPEAGATTLDRIHQTMLLFAAGRGEAVRRFLVDDGVGNDERFWRLANALSALYPAGTDEKRWVDGVLARKKGLGF